MNKIKSIIVLIVFLLGQNTAQAEESDSRPVKFHCYTHNEHNVFNIYIAVSASAQHCADKYFRTGVQPIHPPAEVNLGNDLDEHTNPLDCIHVVPFD